MFENKGYNEYSIDNFIKDNFEVYINVYCDDFNDSIKLDFINDYSNNHIIPNKTEDISDGEVDYTDASKGVCANIEVLKSVLDEQKEHVYSSTFTTNGRSIGVSYNDNDQNLSMILEDSNGVSSWNYSCKTDTFVYMGNDFSYVYSNDNLECVKGVCKNKNSEFYDILSDIINGV